MKLVFLWMCALVVERSASFMGNVSRAFCRLAPPWVLDSSGSVAVASAINPNLT